MMSLAAKIYGDIPVRSPPSVPLGKAGLISMVEHLIYILLGLCINEIR